MEIHGREEDTPSGGIFVKESLHSCILEPAVLGAIWEKRLRFGKRIFVRVKTKYVFCYLQDCHSQYFAHKIVILTPNLSVQIVLGSYLRPLHVRSIISLF